MSAARYYRVARLGRLAEPNPSRPLDQQELALDMNSGGEMTQPVGRLTARHYLAVACILAIALALRGAFLWGQAQHNPMFEQLVMDSSIHHEWAERIASGAGMPKQPYFRAPLYYYALAALYKLVGNDPLAGRIAGAITCCLIMRLGALLAGFRAGLLAGLIAACYWPFIYFDSTLLTVGLEVLLDTALLCLLLHAARRDQWWLFLAAGLVGGLAAITRPNILIIVPGVALWLWVARQTDGRPLRRLRAGALLAVGLALPILPVAIRNHVVGGEPVLIATNGGVNFYIGNNPRSDGYSAVVPGTRADWMGGYIDTHQIAERELGHKPTEREVSDYWYAKAFDWIRANPGAWALLTLHKFRIFWSPIEMPNDQPIWFFARMSPVSVLFWIGFPVVACAGIAGLMLLRKQWRSCVLLVSFLILYMTGIVAFFVCGRYRLPIVPVLIVCAAAGLTRAADLLRTRSFGDLRTPLIAAMFVGAALLLFSPKMAAFNAFCDAVGHRDLGQFYSLGAPDRAPDRKKAIEHYRQSLRLEPNEPHTLCLLAWLLAGSPEAELRNGIEALSLVRKADDLVRQGYATLDTREATAAAYAEMGAYYEATRIAREVAESAAQPGSGVNADEAAARLRLYEQRRPFRLPK